MPWGYVSDFDTYEGFRCSKKVDKHCLRDTLVQYFISLQTLYSIKSQCNMGSLCCLVKLKARVALPLLYLAFGIGT